MIRPAGPSGRRTLAIVALEGGRFAPREIELGLETGEGLSEVMRGVEPGERVVVSSQFLIDSESKLQEAIQKLLAAEEKSEPDAGEAQEPPEPAEHEHHHHHGHSMPMDAPRTDGPPSGGAEAK